MEKFKGRIKFYDDNVNFIFPENYENFKNSLGELLGLSEENLYRDYLFSNFGLIYSMRTPQAVKTYLETIMRYMRMYRRDECVCIDRANSIYQKRAREIANDWRSIPQAW